MLFLHLKPCVVVYSQEMSGICNWEYIWRTKSTISQLRDEYYAEVEKRHSVCKLFVVIVKNLKDLYSQIERR